MSDKDFEFDLDDIIAEFNDYTAPAPEPRRRRPPAAESAETAPAAEEKPAAEPAPEKESVPAEPVPEKESIPAEPAPEEPGQEAPVVEILHTPKHAAEEPE